MLLGKARLFSGHVAPFLHHRLLHLSGVGFGSGAHLFGHIDTLLCGLQLGHELGHMTTGSLRFERALFLGDILNDSLGLFITGFSTLLKPAASWGTQFSRLLSTSSDGGVLLHFLLVNVAHLFGPLGALGEGGVTTGFIVTFFFLDGLTLNHVILNIVLLLLGPALRFVLSSTNLRSLNITVFNQWLSAHLHNLIHSRLLEDDETALSEVLLAILLLLGLVVGGVGGVTTSH